MKASLKNYHQSPRKTRLVADFIRGKSVERAKQDLTFLPKKASSAIEKLLDSAVSNAKELGASEADLYVKTIAVDKGQAFKRFRPFARGRAGRIAKTMSHVTLELGTHGTMTHREKAVAAPAIETEATEQKKPAARKKSTAKKVAKKSVSKKLEAKS